MIFHLGKPGAGVEEVVVAAPVHHPRGLCHQPLLQEVSEAAGQDLPRPSDEVEAAGVKLPDHDDARLQRQGLVLLPQEVAPAGGRILEVVGVDDTSHALPGGHQRPANVQIPAKGIIVLGYRGPHHSLTAKIPGSVVDNVSGTEIIINGSLSLIIPELMCHPLSLTHLPLTLCSSGAHILSRAQPGQVSRTNTHELNREKFSVYNKSVRIQCRNLPYFPMDQVFGEIHRESSGVRRVLGAVV